MRTPILLIAFSLIAAVAAPPAEPSPGGHTRSPRVLAADASKGRIAVFDATGKIVWEAKIERIHDLQYLANGNILFQTSWTRLVEMTPDHEVVWSYDSATKNGNRGKRVEVHSFRRLAGDVTMIAESGPSRIIEVDRAGVLLRSIALKVSKSNPHRDTRLVRKLQNGNYLVAHEGDGAVREYDASGKVVWDYPVPLFGKKRQGGHGLAAWGNQTFAAIRLPNGNTLISTGNGHSVLEVTRRKEIVWHLQQDDLPRIRLAWVTTLELLPDGNYLIGNCHAGRDQPQIIEITPQKRVVWTFKDFANLGNSLSNSTRIDAHEDAAFYRDKVQPILQANCYKCHGTRDKKIRGGLWLRARRNVVRGGESGPIVDLVEPAKSRILRFINHEDAEHEMPPDNKLAAADIDVLAEWVQRGVPMTVMEDEWTYEKPSLFSEEALRHWSFQPIANPAPPRVANGTWCRGDLDRFILKRLEGAGLAPNPEADRISFLRRATYGLTGLPPTREEIARFIADDSPQAHSRVVDRLLASPHYGEHWGRHWLDLVRFAETNGYERDGAKPEVWKYRQYVIDAFNDNKRYDRFVREQIAGDELPDANPESITATGFLRLGLWDDEPADSKQALFDGLDDVIRTTSEVFLGLTMGCARCHDHKLDPIPQRDYYSMLAVFRNIRPYSKNRKHILTDVATKKEREAIARKNRDIRKRRGKLTARRKAISDRFVALHAADMGSDLQTSDMRDVRFEFYRDTWTELPDFDGLKAETTGVVESNLFDIGLSTRPSAFGFVFAGRLLVPRDGSYTFHVDSDDGSRLSIAGKPLITYDGIHGLGSIKNAQVALRKGEHPIKLEYFQRTGGKGLEVSWSGPGFARRILSKQASRNAARRLDRMINRYGARLLGHGEFREYKRLRNEVAALKDVRSSRLVLSVREPGPKAPPTHVLIRGSAHAPAAEVEPAYPQILTTDKPHIRPRPTSSGRRLAFANWLVNNDNKLTARVMVNRVWQFHFGRGVVRTSSDFGMQGLRPTHPKLLDWLAQRFIGSGFDLKKLHKLIMLSAAYRMSTADNERARAADPANDLLWRFDLRRLAAEEIRDSILAITGSLDRQTIGGPSVYPRIPLAVLVGQSRNTWKIHDSAAHNTRRSIYTFAKRSMVDPFIESFDGATTDTSCAVRFQTMQPTQALTMLNSRFINDAAKDLATRLRKEAGTDPRRQVTLALQLATGRTPDEKKIRTGTRFLASFSSTAGEKDKDAALQQFCLIVLNLNAFFFVD